MEIQPVAWLVQNEWGPLQAVMVGTGVGMGDAPKLEDTFDPQSRKHVLNGTYPTEVNVTRELDLLVKILKSHNVRVFRPDLIGMNQVFRIIRKHDVMVVMSFFALEKEILQTLTATSNQN